MKKKILSTILSAAFLSISLFGCSAKSNSVGEVNNSATKESTLSVVCTVFPQYDWVRQILGNQLEGTKLTLLLDKGVDLHSYQPTAEDIVTISNADLFIYVGGESDAWVEDVLVKPHNERMVVLNLMDILKGEMKEEEVVQGMQADTDHHDEAEEARENDAQEAFEYDEHVWLSLKNATKVCHSISEALSSLDSQHAEGYQNNCEAYITQLSNLDAEYDQVVTQAERTTLLFGDRFPFRYLVDDYQLTYYAAFVGCSAETEASFETVRFLASKVDELKLPVVLVLENSDQKIAKTIINNTQEKNQTVLVLDSMQSVTLDDIEGGANYLSIMKGNLDVLSEALS